MATTTSLLEIPHPGAAPGPLASNKITAVDESRLIKRLFWGLLICVLGIMMGIAGGRFLHLTVFSVIGALIALAGFITSFSVLLSGAGLSRPAPFPIELRGAPITKQLSDDSGFEPVSSITEPTTELLKVENIRTSKRNRS